MNTSYEKLFTYVGTSAVLLLLIGLAGWYFFLSRQTENLEDLATSRGFSIGIPSFSGSRGSTVENIALGFGEPLTSDAAATSSGRGETVRPPRLWRVNATPIAGMGFVGSGSSTALRFVERSSGYIFDVDPETSEITRRTNTLIPTVYEAFVGEHDSVVLITLNNAGAGQVFSGSLGTTTNDGFVAIDLTDLGTGVENINLTTDPALIFLSRGTQGSRIVRVNMDGTESEELLQLGIGHVGLQLVGDGIVITERAASGIFGSSYLLTKQGALRALARDLPGLSTRLHPDGTALLTSQDTGAALSLFVQSTNDATRVQLPLKTVAEKCVWARNASHTAYCAVPQTTPPNFLDNWYRGRVHTSDSWYTILAGSASTTKLLDLGTDRSIDVENPTMDHDGRYIAFMNARDKSLWLLRVAE